MKKILSVALVAGMLLSAVPASYAGNAPLNLNHKLDEMTINTEKLETLETTHMLSNAFSLLCKGVKAVGNSVRSFVLAHFGMDDATYEMIYGEKRTSTRTCGKCTPEFRAKAVAENKKAIAKWKELIAESEAACVRLEATLADIAALLKSIGYQGGNKMKRILSLAVALVVSLAPPCANMEMKYGGFTGTEGLRETSYGLMRMVSFMTKQVIVGIIQKLKEIRVLY
jgi:hypothetical protein